MSPHFRKKNQTLKTAKKPGKLDKHGHNFVIFSQATGQTWNHTSAYHLSTLGQVKKFLRQLIAGQTADMRLEIDFKYFSCTKSK